MTQDRASRVASLVLVRLLTAGDKGATLAQVRKDLTPLVEHRWSGAAWEEKLGGALDGLQRRGLIARGKGKAGKYLLLPAGQAEGLAFLRLDALPPKTTWAKLKKTSLLVRVLALPAPSDSELKQLGKEPIYKALIIKRHYGLPIDATYPTAKQATEALVCKLIGIEPLQRFTLSALKAAVLNRELKIHPPLTEAKALQKIVAKAVGARRDRPEELREAPLRRWIDESEDEQPSPQTAPVEEARRAEPAQDRLKAGLQPGPPSEPAPLDLPTFAERVLAAARSTTDGRFGDHKVFIAHAWKAARQDPVLGSLDLETFKHNLVRANQARLLDLVRADLVEAMDPSDVRQSETRHLGASYHFLVI